MGGTRLFLDDEDVLEIDCCTAYEYTKCTDLPLKRVNLCHMNYISVKKKKVWLG